jgi:hypothetical protein
VPVSTRPAQHSDALYASPSSIDYRQSGVVTSVKNQGSCGCCWAFSTVGEFESKISMSTGITYDLSEQYLLQCDTTSYGCNGGYPYSALQLAQSTGIPRETDYPYQPYSRYTAICTNSTGRIRINSPITNINYYLNVTVEQLQQDLVNYGPINVAVCGSNSAFNFAGSSGLISCTHVPLTMPSYWSVITPPTGLLKIHGGPVGAITDSATSPRIHQMTVISGELSVNYK